MFVNTVGNNKLKGNFCRNLTTEMDILNKQELNDLKERMLSYADDEITDILKRRNHYMPSAVKLAVAEAISRGIINNEDDLLAEDYRIKPHRFHLFPPIPKPDAKHKLIISLSRIILLVGLIPTVYGMFKFAGGEKSEAFLLMFSGGLWIASSVFFMRTQRRFFLFVIFIMIIVSLVFVVYNFLNHHGLKFMDYFVTAVVYILLTYCLIYIWKLISA